MFACRYMLVLLICRPISFNLNIFIIIVNVNDAILSKGHNVVYVNKAKKGYYAFALILDMNELNCCAVLFESLNFHLTAHYWQN